MNVSAILFRRLCPLFTAYVMAIVTAPQARAQVPWTEFEDAAESVNGYAADLAARFLHQVSAIDPHAVPMMALADRTGSLAAEYGAPGAW
jgi:hypothetical protein